MKNPIKSMSGNMWSALRFVRTGRGGVRYGWHVVNQHGWSTLQALRARGLVVGEGSVQVKVTSRGREACDAFTEGQESVR